MTAFAIEQDYENSADEVWKVLSDFGGIGNWMPGIESCVVEGNGVGAVRKIGMPGGTAIEERLEAFDDSGRSLSYSIGASPLPVQDYLATIAVKTEGKGCSVSWSAEFKLPEGVPDEAIIQALEGAYGGALAALKSKLEG